MSPPKATPDMKQRCIASFFGGAGGGGAGGASAGAAKKTAAVEATMDAAEKASASAEADAAATVVDAKPSDAGKKGGETDVIMVDSLDSDVKREASPAPKKEDDDDEPTKKPAKRLRKVADKEKDRETTAPAEPEAEAEAEGEEEPAAAAAAATKPSPSAAARKSPPPSAAAKGKGKGKATAPTPGDDDDDGEKVEGVGAGALAAAAAHAAADVEAAAASWPAGSPVPFEFLADVFESVADETKRLVIANRLATAFRAILAATPGDLLPAVYLCTNRVAPAHAGVELGVGDATLIRALAEATGRSEAKVKLDLDRRGDLGVVAAEARAAQKVMFKPRPLTVASVYAAFRDIAASSGSGSSERKRGLIKKLLSAAGRREAGYVVRGLQGKLRIGLAEQTVLAALAVAAELHHSPPCAALSSPASSKPQKLAEEALLANRLERAAQAVKRAYCECPSYDVVVPALVARAPALLPEAARFVAGVPVKPMLAKPATGVSEVLDRAAGGELLAEYKYDGERAQVHVFWEEVPAKTGGGGGGGGGAAGGGGDGGGAAGAASPSKTPGAAAEAAAGTATTAAAPPTPPAPNLRRRVAIYSRNSEDNSGKYPDVAEAVLRALAPGVRELVLDAEVVAIDRASGKILPFQVLSTRKRGTVTAAEVTVPVCLFAFDCLYKDGETLLRRPLAERREALAASLVERPGEVQVAVGSRESGVEQLAAFLDEAVAGGTEGLIVKTLDSTYEPSRRSTNWLKLKKDYLDGVGDTFDVVVLGAWHGRGKRTGVFGAFLLAVYDSASETYQSISKIGTGFSEAALESIAARLSGHVIAAPRSYYAFGETVAPDVWFEPAVVWEVKAADLSVSPVHKAAMGLVDRSKGISIRFPRLVRERDDKRPEQATSAAQVADMYRRQALTMNQAEVDGEKNKKNGTGGGGGGGGGGGYDDDDYY